MGKLIVWIGWVAGFVLAKGIWQTVFCIIPFYSWYLVIERIMMYNGW